MDPNRKGELSKNARKISIETIKSQNRAQEQKQRKPTIHIWKIATFGCRMLMKQQRRQRKSSQRGSDSTETVDVGRRLTKTILGCRVRN